MALSVAPAAGAQRVVHGAVIASDTLPAASLRFDTTLTYAGTQTVMLSARTRAEQHFFVDATRDRRVRRLYWVQFEGPGRYTYSGDAMVSHDGLEWRENFRFYPTDGLSSPPGSDGDQARRFLEAAGYRFGPDLARLRLVWLLEPVPAEHEVMIIYLEDLADTGLNVAALRADAAAWEALKPRLRARALAGLRVHFD